MQKCEKSKLKKLNIQKESYNAQKIHEPYKKIILYFDLTNNYESLIELESLFNEKFTQNSLRQFEFEQTQEYNETEYIQLYYFQGLIWENSNDEIDIDISQLTKVRINLLKLAQQIGKCQIKVVLQYHHSQIQEKQYKIEHHIFQLFDGFLQEQQNVILLSRDEKQQQIISYLKQPNFQDHQFSQFQDKKINLQSNKDFELMVLSETNNQFINHLNSAIGFFQFEYNEFCSIGFECYLYLRDELEVLSQLILINIKLFYHNIYELLELPTNLNNEKDKDEDVKKFLKLLYSLIIRFLQIINQKEQIIQIIVQEIHTAIQYWEPRILSYLKCMAQNNKNFSLYSETETIFQFNYEQIRKGYQSKLLIFQDFTQDILKSFLEKDLEMISLQCSLEVKYFDIHLPSRLKQFQNINNFSIQQKSIDKTNVCLLGLTKTGKSTLFNILINPKNIGIIKKDKKKYFSVIDKNNQITIVQSCKSETRKTFDIEIDNFIFTDTPGFLDTDSQNRLINQVKIFTQLQRVPQIIFLILIDGSQLCENINDLYFTIEHIYLFFGDKLIESQLEKFIIPVFNKLESYTMNKIKNILEEEIETHSSNNKINYFLKAIKNIIDSNRHIEIQNASYFLNKNERQHLKKQMQEIYKKISNLLRDNKMSQELKDLNEQVGELQNQIDIKQTQKQQINYELLENIKQQILNQCKYLQEEQIQKQLKIVLNLSLNAEMKEHYNIIIKYQDEICKHLLILITDVIINNLVNDHSRNVDDVHQLCSQIQKIVEQFKNNIEKNISVFSFFDSLIEKFHNIFQNQRLIEDLIKKLNSINNLSKFILNGQKIKEISIQYLENELGIKYLENELNLVIQSCINLDNNQDLQNFKKEQRFKRFKIQLLRFIRFTDRAEIIQQSINRQLQRLKMDNLKNEYKKIKQSQVTK